MKGIMKTDSNRSDEPAAIVYATIEQAVDDIQYLVKNGLIRNGRAITKAEWPRTKKGGMRKFGFFKPADVGEVVYFFTHGDFRRMLEMANSTIDADAALSRLGLKDECDEK